MWETKLTIKKEKKKIEKHKVNLSRHVFVHVHVILMINPCLYQQRKKTSKLLGASLLGSRLNCLVVTSIPVPFLPILSCLNSTYLTSSQCNFPFVYINFIRFLPSWNNQDVNLADCNLIRYNDPLFYQPNTSLEPWKTVY